MPSLAHTTFPMWANHPVGEYSIMEEEVGFEPTVELPPYASFQDW